MTKQLPANVSTLPVGLTDPPDRVVEIPPVETRIGELPFGELTWENYERLLYRLVTTEADVDYCNRYGRSGQAQAGIDIYGRLNTGQYTCWQGKNRKRFRPSHLCDAVDLFLNGEWAERSLRFVLCVRASLADIKLQDAIEAQAVRLSEREIDFQVYDGVLLSDRLRAHPQIIDDFFSRQWVVAFAGPEAAASLSGRLDGAKMVNLRKRLVEIYDARFRQLDPGLVIEPGVLPTSDIRSRFVAPDVDISSPFSEPTFDATDDAPLEPKDYFPGDEDDSFPHDSSATPQLRASEIIEPPRLKLEDWIQLGQRSALLGAAGSGKSTVLRCLALDLLGVPAAFPSAAKHFGDRIPLLISFALWCRITEKCEREVGLAEVLRETFGAFVPASELEDSFVESLLDERLLLLIDGLDEYSNEQAARLTLATIESFVQSRNIKTIVTARPAGLRRLGTVTGDWQVARLTELSKPQQQELAIRLLTDNSSQSPSVSIRVSQFFEQLERTGRLQSLAGNPLLLRGLLSVASRQAILPRTRFQLFQKLIEVMLDVHPSRRATAASEVTPRTRAFAADDLRRDALSRLAFEIHKRGADAGMERNEAFSIVEIFLKDPNGPGWSTDRAREGAAELINIDADTTGLLIERSPQDIAFCHATFREHLAGFELGRWSLEDLKAFASKSADDPRWRGPILTVLQSLRRQSDVQSILKEIKGDNDDEHSIDRRLLLADAAFSVAPLAGTVGQDVAESVLDTIEDGTDEAERLELLGLALDGPRAGSVGEEITRRLVRWWPGTDRWRPGVYEEIGRWAPNAALARALFLGLHDDEPSNRLAAAAGIARAFKDDNTVREQLTQVVYRSSNTGISAAALDALCRGWDSLQELDELLEQAARSSAIPLRRVAILAKYRRGWRGDEARDALLDTLDEHRSGFMISQKAEIATALVTDWGDDPLLQDACWAGVNRLGPSQRRISYDTAQSILLRIHHHDPRVGQWLCEEFQRRDRGMFGSIHDIIPLLAAVLEENGEFRAAIESWFKEKKYNDHDHHASQLAAVHKSEAAKQALIDQIQKQQSYRFWAVSSLLQGWGMEDPEVASTLEPLARSAPDKRQDIAEYIPDIVGDPDESYKLLMEICALPEPDRPDFVIRGFAALRHHGRDADIVGAIMPHVPARWGVDTGVHALIEHYHSDSRVREFSIRRLQQRSPPLAVIAKAYAEDAELKEAVLERASPLPTFLRRLIAKRASQRYEDDALHRVLLDCDLETDGHAKAQATIGLARSALVDVDNVEELTRRFSKQIHAIGPDMDDRRVAAFAGLLVLGRVDVFAESSETPEKKPLSVPLTYSLSDYTPVIELIADNWGALEDAMHPAEERFSRFGGSKAGFWKLLAPYANRSPELKQSFLEYCGTDTALLDCQSLLTLWHLKPRSPLLQNACIRVLDQGSRDRNSSPLDNERSMVVASKCLCSDFASDNAAQDAMIRAVQTNETGTVFVGFAAAWPNHVQVLQKWEEISSGGRNSHRLLWCAWLCIAAAHASSSTFTNGIANFATRTPLSPWDFAADSLAAIRARLEDDAGVREDLIKIALRDDEPSIRASVPRLLSSVQPDRDQGIELANKLLEAELKRSGLPRFGLDLLTNRYRRVQDILRDVAETS